MNNLQIKLSPRPALDKLPPSIHGACDHQELMTLGLSPDEMIDFSTNANPYGPAPQVVQALQAATVPSTLAPYPDRGCLALREAISRAENIPPDHLLPGNGTAELIQLIALAFIQPQTRHLILGPTFGEYERAIYMLEGNVQTYRPHTRDLRFAFKTTKAIIQEQQPDSVWLCNPNNPTGQLWPAAQLAALQAAAPRALWVIDEAYRHFPRQVVSAWRGQSNLIILRSMTKDQALAGLRLGYAVANPEIIQDLSCVQAPWSVNALAQVAGVAALQAETQAWLKHNLDDLRQHARALWSSLKKLGLYVLPTDTTFALVEVPQTVPRARAFRRRLLNKGLIVRDATSFGLPSHVRIASRRPEENARLFEAISEIRNGN